jgi:transcriptional regulator with XRE-family HTH domain
MSDIQNRLLELKAKGWTYASIADEVGVTSDAVEKWKAGARKNPHSEKAILLMLVQLVKKKPPKQRRYKRGSRQSRESNNGSK